MPEDATVIELVNRMAGIEARLKSNEDKSDRIEGMLHELGKQLTGMNSTSDDRIEKIVHQQTEPVKDQLRESKAKIESLEGGRRYNVVQVSAVCGTLFAVFTWFNNQNTESTRQLIISENATQRSETQNRINDVSSQLMNRINTAENGVSQISTAVQGYPEFKAQVTQQNATSMQDRKDQSDRIMRLEQGASELAKEVRGISSTAEQKFTEVETQFNADGQVRNVQFSDQQRTNAMIVNSIHDLGGKMPEYPSAPYYQPNVSQRPTGDNH
jgi:DNA anti-recombination protein RmuC